MKKMFKAAALLAAAVMVMGFVSCSDSDDSNDTVLPAQESDGGASSGGSETGNESGDEKKSDAETPSLSTYSLDASTMALESGHTDGEETAAGTSNFYTIVWSANMVIDASAKTFSDGYVASQRINLKGAWTNTKQYIKFTTTKAATVKVWWVAGGDARSLDIAKKSDRTVIIASDQAESVKNSMYISTLTLEDADTYMLGSADGGNYIFKIEITE